MHDYISDLDFNLHKDLAMLLFYNQVIHTDN